jgi:hypothetical protein
MLHTAVLWKEIVDEILRLATNFGPSAKVNSGPPSEVKWAEPGVWKVEGPGLKRSGSPGSSSGVLSRPLGSAFLDRSPETIAIGTGFDDVSLIGNAV